MPIISVNNKSYLYDNHYVTRKSILELAGYILSKKSDPSYSITYRNANIHPRTGVLKQDDQIKVQDGTSFYITVHK